MNFLALCNRLKRKCRVQGAAMTAVTGQIDEYTRLIDFVNEAWMDIQLFRENWFWMLASASCTTVAGQATYSPTVGFALTDFGSWKPRTFRVYLTSAGTADEMPLEPIDYDCWRDTYQFRSARTQTNRPMNMTVTPANAIGLGPVPVVGYTVTGDYFKAASELAATTDTPTLPTQYHQLIVYRAMMLFGASEAAGEVFQEGQSEFKRMMGKLVLNQLPETDFGGTLE